MMWLGLTLGSFGIAVTCHAILCRIPFRLDFVAKSLLAGIPVGLALALLGCARYGFGIQTAASLLLYAFLFELYIFSFTLVSTSVSVALLLKLRADPLTPGEIDRLYSSTQMVAGRIEKMIGANFLIQDGSSYRVTRKARMMLVPFRLLRFFFHRSSARDPGHEQPQCKS
jgi:hypothetical protein